MIRAAIWLLEHQWNAVNYIAAEDAHPADVMALKLVTTAATAPIWAGVAVMPYWKMHQQSARMAWAVKDVAHTARIRARFGSTAAKFRTMTYWNWFPKHRAFAGRSAARFAITKVGARFIPYVGWGLLAYDLYSVGKWVHGKTRWGNPTPGPTP